MKKLQYGFAILTMLLLLSLPALAQLDPGDPGGDPEAPIDGGLSLLVAAGVGYGAKKLRDARKKKEAGSTKL